MAVGGPKVVRPDADEMPVASLRTKTGSSRAPRVSRTEQGSSLVEFAMVAPFVMSLLLGLFTGGAAYAKKISLVDAVREGGRHGSTLLVPTTLGGAAAWEAAVRDRVVHAAGGALVAADVCVKLVLATGGTDCGIKDPPGSSAGSGIHLVKVSASVPATVQVLFTSFSPTLKANLATRYERDTG
jgi:hypothetical protein